MKYNEFYLLFAFLLVTTCSLSFLDDGLLLFDLSFSSSTNIDLEEELALLEEVSLFLGEDLCLFEAVFFSSVVSSSSSSSSIVMDPFLFLVIPCSDKIFLICGLFPYLVSFEKKLFLVFTFKITFKQNFKEFFILHFNAVIDTLANMDIWHNFEPFGCSKIDSFSNIEAPIEASMISSSVSNDEFAGVLNNPMDKLETSSLEKRNIYLLVNFEIRVFLFQDIRANHDVFVSDEFFATFERLWEFISSKFFEFMTF